MAKSKRSIALIAHDNKKAEMVLWAKRHRNILEKHDLVATRTTGTLLEAEAGLKLRKLKSGPLGGDLQIGARVAEGKVDLVVFFWDPLSPHSHDVDIKALLRITAVYDIPIACDRASADLMIDNF